MYTLPIIRATRRRPDGPRRRGVLTAIAAVSLALLAGCSASAAQPATSPTSSPTRGSTGNATGNAGSNSSGIVSSGNKNGAQGNSGSGSFSLAFAKCMQTHGVSAFPDPDGQAGQLSPSSGVDPTSQQFQSALNGPCLSLAPPAWVSSGKVTP